MLTKAKRSSRLAPCATTAHIAVNLSWYTVNPGNRAAILRNGALVGVSQPGIQFKRPLIDKSQPFSIHESVRVYGNREDRTVESFGSDQQPAKFRVSVNHYISADRVADSYSTIGGEATMIERLLDLRVYQPVKNVFRQLNAPKPIPDHGALSAKMRENLESTVISPPIMIDRPQAESDVIRMRGETEASAIMARAAALGENPNFIPLTEAEKWNGMPHSTMIPGGTVPFIAVAGGSK